MKDKKGRIRGPYNVACDVCARKKIKCDGIRSGVCQPCQSQGRHNECTWNKNPARKAPRTEAYVEALHKQAENLRKHLAEFHHYADYLESLLEQHHQQIDFRASRPSDSDSLLGNELDLALTGDDNDQASDDGDDPSVKAICIPPQGIHVETFIQPSRFPALAQNPDGIYVLLVDGVRTDHYNPTFNWSRHLSPTVPLDRRSHDKALDLLFKFFTSWCLRIVPALFLRDMYRALSVPASQAPPKTPHYSPMLHNALVALALGFLDDPKFTDLKSRKYFADHAKSLLEAECQTPNLSVVHALSILASFHSSQGEQALGYMYFGMSARMSQALGLNTDCSEWVKLGFMDDADRLDRHWVNWTTFTQDVCWSLYVGRDFCVAEPIDAGTPNVISMSHIDPEFDEMPWFYMPAGIPPQPNNLTKTFEATCRLLMIARRIMDVINGLNRARSRPLVLDALISDIDVQLNMWKSSLTPEVDITPKSLPTATPHRLMLHLSYWWLFILLHRPFFHRKSRPIYSTDREIDHVKLCRRAAENIMELLATWRALYKLRYCPITLIQTVFSAGTVYLLTAIQASSGIRIAQKELRHSLDQETLVLQYLQEIGVSWRCAANISSTLRNLMHEQVRPLLERKTIPMATAALHISSSDAGDDEDETSPNLSRSSSKGSYKRKWSAITKTKQRQITQPRVIPSGSSQSPLSTSPRHLSTSPGHLLPSATSPAQVSLAYAQVLNSPTITISSAHQAETSTPPSAPIAIPLQRSNSSSSSPPSFPGSGGLQPGSTHSTSPMTSPGSSPVFPSNYSPAFSHRSFRGYSKPSSNYMDDPFSGNSNEDIGHALGDPSSFMTYNFQPSSSQSLRNHYAGGFLAMLGGQTLSEAPFVGPFSEVEVPSPQLLPSSQSSFGTSTLDRASSSSSIVELVLSSSSQGDNDMMDLDNCQWDQYFGSS